MINLENRISNIFKNLKLENKKAFISFTTAGFPNEDIKNGINFDKVIGIAKEMRAYNQEIGLVMMGYLNNIFIYGIEKFAKEVSGIIDAVICVDLPADVVEEAQLKQALKNENIALIKLITPTTSDSRIKTLVEDAEGFIYSVNVAGITGVKSAEIDKVNSQILRIKKYTDLPVVSGFGIKTVEDVKNFSQSNADGVVIGSAIVEKIQEVSKKDTDKKNIAKFVEVFCSELIENLNS